jgi:hypothetical protein
VGWPPEMDGLAHVVGSLTPPGNVSAVAAAAAAVTGGGSGGAGGHHHPSSWLMWRVQRILGARLTPCHSAPRDYSQQPVRVRQFKQRWGRGHAAKTLEDPGPQQEEAAKAPPPLPLPWTGQKDPKSNRTFYYNPKTGDIVWAQENVPLSVLMRGDVGQVGQKRLPLS